MMELDLEVTIRDMKIKRMPITDHALQAPETTLFVSGKTNLDP
jgi:hypothetical protein